MFIVATYIIPKSKNHPNIHEPEYGKTKYGTFLQWKTTQQ
jgi:hypothetical protein